MFTIFIKRFMGAILWIIRGLLCAQAFIIAAIMTMLFGNGSEMVYGDGDGDGDLFGPFTECLDVIGHELI